ncbi:hypothetical protein M514_26548 [Trichuris suis]|uniref:Reverse transcriptase domain-containing protein n=1 Tax=Trichuris suis TaxID=68888 RepID=A0A085MVQ4_9BILA|nr:hypothetical protein M514_26548 [Trichuris suis]
MLRPYTGKRSSYVKNSKEFCNEIRHFHISSSEILVSYDVKDLFTSIPITRTLDILETLLVTDVNLTHRTNLSPFHILKLVSFSMKEGNYFRFQEEFFQQNNGAPMGSPLSPIFAEIFMEHLEEEAFNNKIAPTNPRLFKRYVDDIFAIVEVGKEELLLEHLNCLFPNCISFTIEKETRGRLPFLDALVIRSKNRLKTTVYRKPTHSDRYLHFSSHHPRSVFTGIIRGMVDRALSICDAEFLEGELRHIKRTLSSNGCPNNLVSSVIRRMTNTPTVSRQKEYGPVMVLPYYTGIGELFKRLGKTLGFTVYFKTSCSLRTFLRNDKIKVPADKRPGVIYKITCGCVEHM